MGTKLVATSVRVILAKMEVVPRRLRNTVTSVKRTVALQTLIIQKIAASIRQTVVRRDSESDGFNKAEWRIYQ
jgi:hypothetical protein